MHSTIALSVILPSYNEEQNIKAGVLNQVYDFLSHRTKSWELILSDDGSTDSTPQLLDAFAISHPQVKVLHNHHAGKAATVRTGMLAARGEWRLFSDFDQSTPLSEVDKLMKYVDSYQVVIGSREGAGAAREKEPWYRHLMGRVFNLAVRIIAVPAIKDTQCGFKLFSAQACQDLFQRLYVYGPSQRFKDAFTGSFDVELLFLARKMQYQVKEVPIIWRHRATNRVSPIKDSVRMFRDILRVRWADLRGMYHLHQPAA